MKRKAWLMVLAVCLTGCTAKGWEAKERPLDVAGDAVLEVAQDTVRTKSLNDIRFGDWEDADWLDNEYIRTLRSYLDAFNKGEVENEDLEPYRELVKSQFVVGDVESFVGGGLLLYVTFLDDPDKLFWAWVYSDVDEVAEKVVEYRVLGVSIEAENIGVTKEELLNVVKEHPELKLW